MDNIYSLQVSLSLGNACVSVQNVCVPHAGNNESHTILTGLYKPQIKCYELAQLSLKFERHLDNEIVKFEV
jgi:hypothetical protein